MNWSLPCHHHIEFLKFSAFFLRNLLLNLCLLRNWNCAQRVKSVIKRTSILEGLTQTEKFMPFGKLLSSKCTLQLWNKDCKVCRLGRLWGKGSQKRKPSWFVFWVYFKAVNFCVGLSLRHMIFSFVIWNRILRCGILKNQVCRVKKWCPL